MTCFGFVGLRLRLGSRFPRLRSGLSIDAERSTDSHT
jgi:hypothetical protein